jgi:xanthine dehydrogenase accessory factor
MWIISHFAARARARYAEAMRELLERLVGALRAGQRVVECRLLETRGSTPQKAGAAMLVWEDGGQFGTLGGGCVEAEVKRRALAALAENVPHVAAYQLDSDYGWDDGLICGGRMVVLVEPIASPADAVYFERLRELLACAEGCTEAIVFDAGKCGLPAAARCLFNRSGELVAALRAPLEDGDAPKPFRAGLEPLSRRPKPSAQQGVAFLPKLPRCRLVIVGAGHVGQAVGNLAPDLDFDVWVVDDRAEYASAARFPAAQRVIVGPIDQVLPQLEVTADTYCLIVTRGHNHDEEALFHLCDRGARYVGLIGSKRKIRLIFDDLMAQGVSADTLARVHAPLGIDIGSQTVPEIAISILAELVAHRNLEGRVPGRPPSLVEAEPL